MKKFFTFFVAITMLCAVGCEEQSNDNVGINDNQYITFLMNWIALQLSRISIVVVRLVTMKQ